jgi:predicted nucleic acid-binding protein/bifunctional DNA-binding transcriptional regulator/antitoxin component of YhaV-PrlF toxin-antitoxin module
MNGLDAADRRGTRTGRRITTEITLTGKNQVSLPARQVRSLGWERGDHLLVEIRGDSLVLKRRPATWTDTYAGMFSDVFGTHEETRAYLDDERRAWEPD